MGRQREELDQDVLQVVTQMIGENSEIKDKPIYRACCDQFGKDRICAERTFMRRLRELRPRLGRWDKPFEWHLMGDPDLPWEASNVVLNVWAWLQDDISFRKRGGFPDAWILQPTMRHAKWWWRVHQAVPEAQPNWSSFPGAKRRFQNHSEFLAFFGEMLCLAEFSTEILEKPIDVSNIWAFFAYGAEHNPRYQAALDEGTIAPLQSLMVITDQSTGLLQHLETNNSVTYVKSSVI